MFMKIPIKGQQEVIKQSKQLINQNLKSVSISSLVTNTIMITASKRLITSQNKTLKKSEHKDS